MILGIVGAEAAKFTERGEASARLAIRRHLYRTDHVVSGACHLGGVDVWAIEEAGRAGVDCHERPPLTRSWTGYRARNVQIAEDADALICIVVARYPPDFRGMRFNVCYHCGSNDHIKSGGCWTTKYARKLGKPTTTIIVSNRQP